MKSRLALTLALLVGAASPLLAQMPGSAGINPALTKLFGKITAFSADMDLKMTGGQNIAMPAKFALLDNLIRVDVDMANLKGGALGSATGSDMMKQMGMDKVTSIIRTDKKEMYLIFPGLDCYVQQPLPKEQAATLDQTPKTETTVLGKETLDGHACTKNKLVMTAADGTKQEAILWNAADLKDFPIQIQTEENGTPVTLKFTNVKFEKPDAKQFSPPLGSEKYESVQAMMGGLMKKMMGGAAGGSAPPK